MFKSRAGIVKVLLFVVTGAGLIPSSSFATAFAAGSGSTIVISDPLGEAFPRPEVTARTFAPPGTQAPLTLLTNVSIDGRLVGFLEAQETSSTISDSKGFFCYGAEEVISGDTTHSVSGPDDPSMFTTSAAEECGVGGEQS